MTEAISEQIAGDEMSEEASELALSRQVVVRTFEAELATEGDGRTLDLRIVPYNKPARVSDPPDYMPYDEVWIPGAFQRQIDAGHRLDVFLNFEHEQGLRGVIGHGVALREQQDGLYGSFRVHENTDGDKALQLVNAGLLRGVSLEAKPMRSVRRDGLVARLRGHLDAVALCRTRYPGSPIRPAWEDAQVLAVRQQEDTEDNAGAATETRVQPASVAMPEDLAARLAALGVQPILVRAVVSKPWDGAASRFTDEEYQRSCLIDRGGDTPVKERCSLPVLEPNGDLNKNALGPAAAALAGARGGLTGVSASDKAAAARKLIRYYRQADMPPPPGLTRLAGN